MHVCVHARVCMYKSQQHMLYPQSKTKKVLLPKRWGHRHLKKLEYIKHTAPHTHVHTHYAPAQTHATYIVVHIQVHASQVPAQTHALVTADASAPRIPYGFAATRHAKELRASVLTQSPVVAPIAYALHMYACINMAVDIQYDRCRLCLTYRR